MTGCTPSSATRRRFDAAPACVAAVVGALLACMRLASLDLPLAIANGERLLLRWERLP